MRSWAELNRAYLCAEIERVAQQLDGADVNESPWSEPQDPALVHVVRVFRLTPFERDIVIMCAGFALETSFATKLVAPPTFGAAIATLRDAHFDAMAPTAPLRSFRLVVLHGQDAISAPLSLDERILHFLLGTSGIDERLLAYTLPARAKAPPLTPTQHGLATRVTTAIHNAETPTVLQLFGGNSLTRLVVAQTAAASLGLRVLRMRASALGLSALELDAVQRLCEREMLLTGVLPVIEVDAFDGAETQRAARAFATGISGVTIISATEPIPTAHASSATFEMPALSAAERCALWTAALRDRAAELAPDIDRLATQFRLDAADIDDIVHMVDAAASDAPVQLWRLCLERSRPRIEDLARRIKPTASWDDLVLPQAVISTLRDLVAQLRHRHAVHELWGFARGDVRGQAITALFAGPSGTGKTLAAEVIARETSLDLYHVDLSQVVDKYVGETEKRLRRIFDAAEAGGAILLFDEADALFGKRAQVERGTDRWANIEVSYLLQRMESYNGLAILTTNAKDALDAAFLRRLRFLVQFPFPDVRLRTELWRRAIPDDAPRTGLDVGKLARLQLTGANIKGIAINAAFYAASEASPMTMQHLLRAARSEFAKLELPFPEADVRNWGASP